MSRINNRYWSQHVGFTGAAWLDTRTVINASEWIQLVKSGYVEGRYGKADENLSSSWDSSYSSPLYRYILRCGLCKRFLPQDMATQDDIVKAHYERKHAFFMLKNSIDKDVTIVWVPFKPIEYTRSYKMGDIIYPSNEYVFPPNSTVSATWDSITYSADTSNINGA